MDWNVRLGQESCDALLMTLQTYGAFAVFAVVVTLVPGPDFAVVTRNALVGGRGRGVWA